MGSLSCTMTQGCLFLRLGDFSAFGLLLPFLFYPFPFTYFRFTSYIVHIFLHDPMCSQLKELLVTWKKDFLGELWFREHHYNWWRGLCCLHSANLLFSVRDYVDIYYVLVEDKTKNIMSVFGSVSLEILRQWSNECVGVKNNHVGLSYLPL